MIIYHYSPKTGEFLLSSEARLDPIDKQPLVPAHATAIKPGAALSDHVLCFDEEEAEWKNVEDHRGELYFLKSTGEEFIISDLGPVPNELTSLVPCEFPIWDDTADVWLTDDDAAAESRINEILIELYNIDMASIRPERAIRVGTAVATDMEKLTALEAQAADLRIELSTLRSASE